ncbi:MAG TPA: hypothetical protein P5044_06815 [bacterium]|nr:hypothetical protein [bacterium]
MKISFIIVLLLVFSGCATALREEPEVRKLPQDVVIFITPDSIKLDNEKKNSLDFALMTDLANKYFDAGRFSESYDLYQSIIKENPAGPEAALCNYNAGLCAMRMLKWNEAVMHFRSAFNMFGSVSDRTDSYLNYLESLKKTERWDAVLKESEKAVNSYFPEKLDEKAKTEISVRMAEALVMTGKADEGRTLARYWQYEIRKKYPRYEAVYIPELAYAHFVAAMGYVSEFALIKLDDTIDSLTDKCRKIIDAQTEFVKAVNVGVVYWSNASAFEISKMYMDLYAEMEGYKVPEDLNDEEKAVYRCELWKKTHNLLKKSRKVLVKSLETAKSAKEDNEYLEKSTAMVLKIDEIYGLKEQSCEKFEKLKEVK